jgi:hypothetical protein
MDIVSVAQNKSGLWTVTLNGTFLGDARSFPTREQAVEYAKKLTANWIDTECRF